MKQLFDLYCSKLDGLKSLHNTLGPSENYDGPFLMCEPPINFKELENRLLIIGQETNGWSGDLIVDSVDTIRKNMDLYRAFGYGEKYNSTFFQYARNIARSVSGQQIFMWTNLNKFGKASGAGRPCKNVIDNETSHFNILIDEIQIVDPTNIVFLTGPNYDDLIIDRIHGSKIEAVGGFTLREFARVFIPTIKAQAYRLYHPGYGNRISKRYLECIHHLTR